MPVKIAEVSAGLVTPTTQVVPAANPVNPVYGQSETFSATVSPVVTGRAAPTGTVTFEDGTSVLGTAPITSGKAMS